MVSESSAISTEPHNHCHSKLDCFPRQTVERCHQCCLIPIWTFWNCPISRAFPLELWKIAQFGHTDQLSNADIRLLFLDSKRGSDQCDKIGRFIGLWVTFYSLCQQLICPNLPTLLGNFCNGVKIYNFLAKSFLGNFYRNLVIFFWSHWKWHG